VVAFSTKTSKVVLSIGLTVTIDHSFILYPKPGPLGQARDNWLCLENKTNTPFKGGTSAGPSALTPMLQP
jgi:hypothetical protein